MKLFKEVFADVHPGRKSGVSASRSTNAKQSGGGVVRNATAFLTRRVKSAAGKMRNLVGR